MLFGILVFASAFLLFLLQPMIGKLLLPHWGGAASVWTACLLFFQVALLAGYAYDHVSVRNMSLRAQSMVHGGLVILALVWLGVPWDPNGQLGPLPAWDVLRTLSLAIGAPALLLCSTSPLLSAWHAQSGTAGNTYRLYALSNLGSLLGCLAYPFLVEPWIGLRVQQFTWKLSVGCFAMMMLIQCVRILRQTSSQESEHPRAQSRVTWGRRALWVALPCCTSIVLAASTTNISQAGIVVPGLWVLPLAIYLITWWIAFTHVRYGRWGSFVPLYWFGAFLGLGLVMFKLWIPWVGLIAGYGVVVLCIGIACHGLLYGLRPEREHLTEFYLDIAIGGALGCGFVLLVAPLAFQDYWELHIGLALGAVAGAGHYLHALFDDLQRDVWVRRWYWPVTAILCIVLLLALSVHANTPPAEQVIAKARDFYGVVTVREDRKRDARTMVLGQTIHGSEPLAGELEVDRTMYYDSHSGVAWAWGLCHSRLDRPAHVGIIGLGTGALSLYAKKDDRLTYYEISPAVVTMAKEHFRYLSSHLGATDIQLGDGRVLIADEVEQLAGSDSPRLDLLIVDAFSNDSLPAHLLTVQALELYRERLASNGILAWNITNRNLDLAPLLFDAARRVGYDPILIESPLRAEEDSLRRGWGRSDVRWLMMVPRGMAVPPWPGARTELRSRAIAWTDDYGSILQALR